jgi:hypothetical protein
MTENLPPSTSEAAPNRDEDGTQTRPVSKSWVVIGSLVLIIGLAMGFIMSSLGK